LNLAKLELDWQAKQKIESDGEKCDDLNDKARTVLKAETKGKLPERKAPETNFGLSRFLLLGF
jgi:hypothetical protein